MKSHQPLIVDSLKQEPPSERFLKDFYRLWLKIEQPISTDKDKRLSEKLVEVYGYDTLNSVLKKVISHLKVSFANARSLTAAQRVIEQLASKEKANRAEAIQSTSTEKAAEENLDQRAKDRGAMKQRWEQLSPDQKSEIESVERKRFGNSNPTPENFQLQCWLEMDLRRRQGLLSES